MTDNISPDLAALDQAIDQAAEQYVRQSEIVETLRCNSPASEELSAAELSLRECKRALDTAKKRKDQVVGPSKDASQFNRNGTEGLLKRRFFIAPAFEIYGGVAGLYDYGPPGCSVKNNLLNLWRQHFIVEEAMLELEASCLTPEVVLKASGHVEKFSDLMVKDVETDECFRADHLLRDHLNERMDQEPDEALREEMLALRERLDELSQPEMDQCLARYGTKAPGTGNPITPAYPFNLMFKTSIGPSGMLPGYLRPETAQGIFMNFKRLLEYMGGKLPFACAQIGLSFRNEISPKAGLLRVREFQQAEIEHFVNSEDKSHPKFSSIADVKINMYGRKQQMTPPFIPVSISVGDAVAQGLIANETLAYFIARTSTLMKKIGMNMQHVRFRQHLVHEMAHYAADCWDLEINSSYGWVECAGFADRSAYDLSVHSEKSGSELSAREVYASPRRIEENVCVANKGLLGRAFKKDAQKIMKEIAELDEQGVLKLKEDIENDGKASVAGFEISKEQVGFKLESRNVTGRNFTPSVIEPSFGIGRVLYCLWEHSYYVREGGDDGGAVRAVLKLPASIAAVKCAVLPLSKNEIFNEMLAELGTALGMAGLIHRVDDSGQSIGRRYARADEIGTPFGITVDFVSVEDGSVTLRERDSTEQVRCTVVQAVDAIKGAVVGEVSWENVREMYPIFTSTE